VAGRDGGRSAPLRDSAPAAEGLTRPTREEVVSQQERRQQGERAESQRRADEERRARADAARDTFTLTGSDRALDEAEARGQQAMFRRTGLSQADMAAVLEAFSGVGMQLQVAETEADLPASAQKRMESEGIGGVRGMYDPATDKAWIVRAMVETKEEAFFVGLHEAFHRGLARSFGDEVKPILSYIEANNATVRTKVVEYQLRHPEMTRLEAIEEVLADLSGQGVAMDLKGWDRLVQFLRDAIRAIGDGLGVRIPITDKQVMEFVAGVRRAGLPEKSPMLVAADPSPRYLRVFHGTPHDFDRFSLDAIGTGEGAQAYGWGLYFAGKKEVAEHYRKTLSEEAFTIDGKPINKFDPVHVAAAAVEAHGGDAKAALADLSDTITNALHLFPASAGPIYRKSARLLEEGATLPKVERKRGRLYEVEIPEEGEYLLWDKPLSEQPAAVLEALGRLGSQPRELAFRADGDPRNLRGGDFYEALGEELRAPHDDLADDGTAPRGWGRVTNTINDRAQDQRAASMKLRELGIRGIKYLDGSSRHKSLKDIKREFLSELPQDAGFDEVLDLIGSGTFSPANEAILTELAANDWLGFDYPAQAISAALGGQLANYDASPELVKAVADAQDGGTYNYVIFDDRDVQIAAKFSRASAGGAAPRNVLEALAEQDQLFRLPRSQAKTVEEIAAETDLAIKVAPFDTREGPAYKLTMPNGAEARIYTRVPTRESYYGIFEDKPSGMLDTAWDMPGENRESIPAGTGEVYIDVSNLPEGGFGSAVYNIAATLAHNTDRILIGDPSGLSDVAMRRRTENMLSSALKFGTTRHLAPHPRQMAGARSVGVPPLRWTHGDDIGNIEALVQASLASFDYAEPNPVTFEPSTGRFIDRSGGVVDDDAISSLVARGTGREARAGLATLKRNAILRALLPEGSGSASERGRGLLEGLLGIAGEPAASRVFYSRKPVDGGPAASSGIPEVLRSPAPLSRWRDATGRVQFAPGQALYDLIGRAADPVLTRLQLKSMSPELKRALRQMKVEVSKAQETAAAVAKEANKLSDAERSMVSDLIERELDAGTVPPEHAVRLATMINDVMGQQTDELVRLGMLEKDAAERWRGQYLPRYYESKLTKKAGDAWADAMRRLVGRTSVMKGIKGKHLRGRGLYETIPESQLEQYEALGWEVRDPDYQPGLGTGDGTVQVWRDFTREERDKMGEIRDAGFRFVMGYMQTQRDVALGRMFEVLAADPDISSRTATEAFSVQVPTTTVPGTGAKVYGKLAGRWVSKDTLSHLSAIEEAQSDALQLYRQAMGLWKEGKTALNPVSHVNNVLSNVTMAHFAGVSYWDAHKYMDAIRDLAGKSKMVTEAKDAGLFLGTLSEEELRNMLPTELQLLAQKQEGTGQKVGRNAFNLLTFYLRKPMGWAYQAEDTFFRYLVYRDARGRGLEPQEAVDYAQRFIFTYDDLPKGARRVRDFALPFFGYTYKAAPALLHTALTHPLRFAAPAAVLWTINAAAYAIAAGDDDDSWDEALRKYLTDPAHRAQVRAKEKLERELLPPWMKGTTALATPKTLRLGTDEVTKLPLFIDIARIIPGGDLFDVSPNAGGLPLPQPITPSHPLFTTAVAMLGNKDLFFGKELVDSNDTRAEAAEKRFGWLWRQVTPAIAAGNYHWERGMNALAQATGGELKYVPDILGGDATGIGRDGLPVQPGLAAMQTFGIKVRPIDIDRSEVIQTNQRQKMIRDIDAELRTLRRLNQAGSVSDRAYDKALERANEKKDRLREGKTVDGEDRP
jgi:hypothetical protein